MIARQIHSPTIAADEPVSVALELHHHRLDDMLDRIAIDVETGSWSEARRAFSLFRYELEEHMRLEEELLLPALGVGPHADDGPAAVMRAEHPVLRELLEVIEIGLENEYPIGEATETLEKTLADHNVKEERLLYPLFERMATPEAYAAAFFELRPLLGPAAAPHPQRPGDEGRPASLNG
jgi:iron-sulfur cluster repair protein YtfE (RIC family)